MNSEIIFNSFQAEANLLRHHLESVSDQGAEEYVRQFSPDNQTEDSNQEALETDHDDDEEVDSQLIEHLKRFLYNQTSQP